MQNTIIIINTKANKELLNELIGENYKIKGRFIIFKLDLYESYTCDILKEITKAQNKYHRIYKELYGDL